ncbi:hypothetical protein PLICRDRAFT_87253 [Plicaturopsis crispa FD-325 SS-3]|nr:hypothetical protein PLICRDRAFT_87253 [Plicaturopsis crispa FD-325 SS-3]
MPLFGRRRDYGTTTTTSHHHHHESHRDHQAAGYKAALSNPNTTRSGRQHAKHELKLMGRGREAHVPLMTKIRRALGIRSTPRRERHREYESTSRRTTRRTRY